MNTLHRFHTTSTGIRIGIAHTAPPKRELGSEAEKIQTALLRKEPDVYIPRKGAVSIPCRRHSWIVRAWWRLVWLVCGPR